MVTLLDCINRFPEKVEKILGDRDENLKSLFEMLGESVHTIERIILIGSGTSNTAAVTARGFIEKFSGIGTACILSNEFLNNTYVYDKDSLYVFVSQTGNSILTMEAVKKVKRLGYYNVGMTEKEDTELAGEASAHIDLGCGKEEYGMRTLGYCCTVLTLMVMGLEIGRKRGSVSKEEYEGCLNEIREIPGSHKAVSDQAMVWFDRHKEQLMNSRSFTLYGNKSLYGVALEGALKILELSKSKMAVGYEMDDGMHGPTMGFTYANCVIVFNDGGGEEDNRLQLARWAKEEKHNGFVAGEQGLDDGDFVFKCRTRHFKALEFAPFVQVLGYRLAVDNGVDLSDRARHKEFTYFKTHTKRVGD